jgi:hypothetical protein
MKRKTSIRLLSTSVGDPLWRLPKYLLFASVLVLSNQFYLADVEAADESESAVEISIQLEQQKSLFDEQIASLELEYGGFDRSLLEPLQGLATLLIEIGDFEQADGILARRLQILRTLDGLTNLSQRSDINAMITNDVRLQEWRSVTDRFEYLNWLQTQNANVDTPTTLNVMNDLSAWHLASVYVDQPRARTKHFLSSRQLQRDMISLAEEEFGEESELLIPWLYNYAVEQHRLFAFLKSNDELGLDARDDILVRERRQPGNYLREGLNIVKRIRKITEATGNAEAQAMAMIYDADFQMLLGLGTAAKLYRSAKEKLNEAGISEERVEAFFARPVVLPETQFYTSLDQALASQIEYGYTVSPGAEDGDTVVHMGDFIAWNESLPFARRPELPEQASSINTELRAVELRFTINSRGKTRNPKTLAAEPDTATVKRDAQDAVREMQFRPKFVQRRWRRIEDVTMRYLYPPPL